MRMQPGPKAMIGGALMRDFSPPERPCMPHPNGLAQAMAIAGMDVATLARLAEVSAGDIRAFARGQRDLRPAMATRLSAHLQTTAADLLIGLGNGEPPRFIASPPRGEGVAGMAGPSEASRLERFAGRGSALETVLMLSAATLMGIIGWLALLD